MPVPFLTDPRTREYAGTVCAPSNYGMSVSSQPKVPDFSGGRSAAAPTLSGGILSTYKVRIPTWSSEYRFSDSARNTSVQRVKLHGFVELITNIQGDFMTATISQLNHLLLVHKTV